VTYNKDSTTNTKQAWYIYTQKMVMGEHGDHDGEQLGAMNRDECRQGLWGMQFQK